MSTTTEQTIPELSNNQFKALLVSSDPKAQHGPLWYAWHFLQVYTHYGLQLPHTESALKMQLNITNPGRYTWFDPAVAAYNTIFQASNNFITNVFPSVVNLGNDLMGFAREAGKDGNFDAMVELLDQNEEQAALELVSDLRDKAVDNSNKAKQVASNLGGYKGQLVTALGQLDLVKTQIESDDQVSQKTIDELMSDDPKSATSIKAVQNLRNEAQKNYEHYVVVAATSPTYAWVIPIGLISAIVVASVYGVRATDAKNAIDNYSSQLEAMNAKLRTALETQDVLTLAKYGIDNAISKTELAERNATEVQNAWTKMSQGVDVIKDKISGMLKETDGNKKLAAKALIKVYARQAATAWQALTPALHDLMDKPYISVKEGKPTFGEMLTEIKAGHTT